MLVFINLTNQRSSWYLAPLLFYLPFILNGGFSQYIFRSFFPFGYYSASSYPRQRSYQSESFGWQLGSLVVPLLLLIILLQIVGRHVARHGWWGLLNTLFLGVSGSLGVGPGGPARPNRPRNRATVDEVSAVIRKLPTEIHLTEDELKQMTVHDLKVRAGKSGISLANVLEKSELVKSIEEAGGSSSSSCSICCEDYESGDCVRVLPCKHRFHVECVDKWFYSSTDFSRPPACPLCNAELKLD